MGTIAISKIVVGKRHRKDLGDIDGLAKSIREIGLLQPIVVNSKHHLIAGERRLAAVKKLGWSDVAATIVANLDDAHAALVAERDENTERENFTASEAAKLGQQLEELERPKAKERQAQAGPREGRGKKTAYVTVTQPVEAGATRDIVGEAVGMSGVTYQRAKTVVNRGVPELVEAMDKGEVPIYKAAEIAVEEPETQKELLDAHKSGKRPVKHRGNGVAKPRQKERAWEVNLPTDAGEAAGVLVSRFGVPFLEAMVTKLTELIARKKAALECGLAPVN